jgi:hypothetical protein
VPQRTSAPAALPAVLDRRPTTAHSRGTPQQVGRRPGPRKRRGFSGTKRPARMHDAAGIRTRARTRGRAGGIQDRTLVAHGRAHLRGARYRRALLAALLFCNIAPTLPFLLFSSAAIPSARACVPDSRHMTQETRGAGRGQSPCETCAARGPDARAGKDMQCTLL